jgi:pullulanase
MKNAFVRPRTGRCIALASIVLSLSLGCSGSGGGSKDRPAPKPNGTVLHYRLPIAGEFSLTATDPQVQIETLEQDAFGLRYRILSKQPNVELVLNEGGEELERYTIATEAPALWIFAGSTKVYQEAPPLIPQGPEEIAVYFAPKADNAEGWGLHVWDAEKNVSWTTWEQPLDLATHPIYGQYTTLTLPPQTGYSAAPGAYTQLPARLGLIVHRGDEKSVSEDIFASPRTNGNMLFLGAGSSQIYCTPDLKPCGWKGSISGASAHWVSRSELLWRPVASSAERYVLIASKDGSLDFSTVNEDLSKATVIDLKARASVSDAAASAFPHLRRLNSYAIETATIDELVRSELMVAALNAQGRVVEATRVQIGGVLDDVYATDKELGLVLEPGPELRIWAPTAQDVVLKVYNADKQLLATAAMKELNGTWSAPVDPSWIANRWYYRLAMRVFHPRSGSIESYEVTDPYAISLARNGTYSQFVDLNASDLKPTGWERLRKAPIAPTDMSIYELHVRDFSVADKSVPAPLRGTYRAFALNGKNGTEASLGMKHLKALGEAGLTHIQILPAYDFATVNEDPSQRLDLTSPFAKLCKGADFAQEACETYASATIEEAFLAIPKTDDTVTRLNSLMAKKDSYNWGYDPVHYGVPEGSFATEAEGAQRILEFREMVQGLGELGFHFAMDVVYNHTYSSGLFDNSVLDRVVPGYYHRLNAISGGVENSTCCENTATERKMMEKVMIDTLKRWVDDYKVDAFRFDLMGHHMKANMLKAKEVLGPSIYLYGEGWNFGEVADNQRGVNATQVNLGGTGIGTFNDRLRDAVRGGGAFDCGYLLFQQGLVNGLYTDDNERGGLIRGAKPNANCALKTDYVDRPVADKKAAALAMQDRVRLGLAGTLKSYSITTAAGTVVSGDNLEGVGYNQDASETINYVENHDNQTYWDINQIKLPFDLTMAERVRVHNLGISLNTLAMGVPYFELGTDILRSKSLIRDSYDSGDWINQVDFSLETHNWNRGLPPAEKEASNLDALREVVTALPNAPTKADMTRAFDHFRELLRIRGSSPLFRLDKGRDISDRLDFLPGTEGEAGLIVMRLSDDACGLADLDPKWSEILVIFNMKPQAIELEYPKQLSLHPVQQESTDSLLKEVKLSQGVIAVPGRTAAVLVEPQDGRAAKKVCRAVGALKNP